MQTGSNIDLREALFNDQAVGPASHVQVPRAMVTRLHGLAVDLDADILKPNPWFPPADNAETFHKAIEPALARHPVLRHAEIRDTGRWLHAVVWFKEAVELKTARDEAHWTDLHKVLSGSVPADHSAPALITLTRPIDSVNSKTGRPVRVLKTGVAIDAEVLSTWSETVRQAPFRAIGAVLFGDQRLKPCPYCRTEGSHLDLGDHVGFCYGPCGKVPLMHLFKPFLKGVQAGGDADACADAADSVRQGAMKASNKATRVEAKTPAGEVALPVIALEQDTVLVIDPDQVGTLIIKLKRTRKGKKD